MERTRAMSGNHHPMIALRAGTFQGEFWDLPTLACLSPKRTFGRLVCRANEASIHASPGVVSIPSLSVNDITITPASDARKANIKKDVAAAAAPGQKAPVLRGRESHEISPSRTRPRSSFRAPPALVPVSLVTQAPQQAHGQAPGGQRAARAACWGDARAPPRSARPTRTAVFPRCSRCAARPQRRPGCRSRSQPTCACLWSKLRRARSRCACCAAVRCRRGDYHCSVQVT